MKKRVTSKKKKRKVVKPKSSSASIDVEQDIAVLLTTLVQRLASFEMKLDKILNRIMSQPNEAPRRPPQPAPSLPERRKESSHIFSAICAHCGRDCEVPFKPSGNRPVYCRECFTKRKYRENVKPPEESRPQEGTALSFRPSEKPKAGKPAKPAKKKPAAKKKAKKSAKPAKKKKR